jgi:hypothetical protein
LDDRARKSDEGARGHRRRIICDSATGRIFYDADGNGGGAQVLFAQVNAGVALTSGDFSIVGKRVTHSLVDGLLSCRGAAPGRRAGGGPFVSRASAKF